ncbi:MAG: hypothetical protein ABR548_14560 [Actinomycetota bacterium]
MGIDPSRARRLIAACAASVLAAVLGAPFSFAQDSAPQGVEISPVKWEKDLTDTGVSGQIMLINHEATPRKISVMVTGLGHDLDGSPEFLENSSAKDALHVDADSFVLEPAGRKTLAFTGKIPDGEHGLYAAVVAEFAPLTPQAGQIEVRSRVASLFLLRGPKPWVQTIDVVDAGILSGTSGSEVNVFAAAKDTGNVHVRPSGTVKITQGQTVLATVALKAENILPGFARRLVGKWTPPAGTTGKLTFDAALTNSSGHFRKTIDFSGGVAQRPTAKIENFLAKNQGGALIALDVRNTGAVPLSPAVILTATQGKIERARTVLAQKEITTAQSAAVEWKPDLPDGTYVITAQVKAGDELLDQAATDLRIGAVTARPAPLKGADRMLLIIIALLLFVTGFILLLILWKLRDDERGAPVMPIHSPAEQPSAALRERKRTSA